MSKCTPGSRDDTLSYFIVFFWISALRAFAKPCYPGTAMATGDVAKRRHVCVGSEQAGRLSLSITALQAPRGWHEEVLREGEREKGEKANNIQHLTHQKKTHTWPLATPSLGNLLFVFLLIRPTAADKPTWQGLTVGPWERKHPHWKDAKRGEERVKDSWVEKTKIISTVSVSVPKNLFGL